MSVDLLDSSSSWANGPVPPYEPGERSGAWIKCRANMEQEFVIGGYIPGARGFDPSGLSRQVYFITSLK
jgi:hypothetical protein